MGNKMVGLTPGNGNAFRNAAAKIGGAPRPARSASGTMMDLEPNTGMSAAMANAKAKMHQNHESVDRKAGTGNPVSGHNSVEKNTPQDHTAETAPNFNIF